MDALKELVAVVTKNKAKQIEVIGPGNGVDSKIQQLYDALSNDRFENEEDAAAYFYPDAENPLENFNQLKRRLYQRLLNTLFFIDVNLPELTDFRKAFYSTYREYAALKILQAQGAKKAGRYLGEKLLKKSLKYEITDITLNVLRDLRSIYVISGESQKKIKECSVLLSKYSEIFQIEMLAEGYFNQLASYFVKSTATKIELKEVALAYAQELQQYTGRYNTRRFILTAYWVFALRYEIVNDYPNALRVNEEALRLLEEKKDTIPFTNILSFAIKATTCYIQLGLYDKVEQALQRCYNLLPKTTINPTNWFITQELNLIFLFRTQQYNKAFNVFQEVITHKSLTNIPAVFQERWKIYEGYINYFIAIEVIKPSLMEEKLLGKFKLSKFLNEVPEFSKDKRGANISFLIIQVLFLLHMKHYDEAASRLNALQHYSHRYLRKDDTYRSNCFINMLLQIPSSYFNRKVAVRKAKKYADKLAEVPLTEAKQSSEIEPVPYEHLWQFTLASLKG